MSVGRRRTKKGRTRRRVDLRKTLPVLPNLVTLASVFCGFSAILTVANDNPTVDDFHAAAVLLIFAMLFDVLDGRIARLTKTQSQFGLHLDSLADVISFGVAPALLVYKWALFRYPILGTTAGFAFVACGVVRLARFNVMTVDVDAKGPGKYIIGLPIPPAAGILVSLLVVNHALEGALGHERYTIPLFVVTLALSLLMVSTVKFRSFKDLRVNRSTMVLVFLGVGSSLLVWHLTQKPQFVLVWLPSFYILIGLVEFIRELSLKLYRAAVGQQSTPPPRQAG
jgi:CDP-diacylglycerol--serine O-phosphatidyltransferase